MRQLRALFRFVRVLAWALHGSWRVYREFPRLETREQAQAVEVWARQMLRIMGIEVQVIGQPAPGPMLMAANHISWLDILVMHAACHCRFVAKSEIRSWPLVGQLTTAGGSLYIERASRRDAMRVVHQMADALREGDVLAVFPEGRTGDGVELLPFHGNLLQAAITADVPVQPVGLKFVDAATGARSFAPCYAPKDTLLSSMWRTLCAPPLKAQVHYGEPERAQSRERREWALNLRITIAHMLK